MGLGQTAGLEKFGKFRFSKGKNFPPMTRAPVTGARKGEGEGNYLTRSMKVRSTVLTRIFSPVSM
jgi:hypothetical protein